MGHAPHIERQQSWFLPHHLSSVNFGFHITLRINLSLWKDWKSIPARSIAFCWNKKESYQQPSWMLLLHSLAPSTVLAALQWTSQGADPAKKQTHRKATLSDGSVHHTGTSSHVRDKLRNAVQDHHSTRKHGRFSTAAEISLTEKKSTLLALKLAVSDRGLPTSLRSEVWTLLEWQTTSDFSGSRGWNVSQLTAFF